jgi:glutamine synthetase
MQAELARALGSGALKFIRLVWCDNANVIRAKAVHASVLGHSLDEGVGITVGQQALPVLYDAVIPETGLGPVGEARLIPDWSTLAPLPYASGHARALADMHLGGEPWALCPRTFLKRMIGEAARDGLEVRAAFENEFYLLRPTPAGFEPVDDTVFASTLSMDRNRAVIDDLAEALLGQNVPVELYYPESGPGQQEMSVRYGPALAAADRQIVFRETAHAVAAGHGLVASFLPKVFADKAGSGCHLHLSLWREGRNVFPGPGETGGLSRLGRAFLAGILAHLPGLTAIVAPSNNSYRRLRPRTWSGGYRCWGVDNREAALRVPSGPADKGSSHFEIKTVDASANPHLALGAVIAAGLDGVRRDLDPGPPVQVDPGALSDEERAAQHLEPLPGSLAEAVKHLERDDLLLAALGPGLARAFLAVRRAEWEALHGLTLEAEVKLLLERY